MKVYCWKCKECDLPVELESDEWPGPCATCGGMPRRDYQTEAVNIGAGVKT